MSLRDDLAGVLARDSRYTIHAYAFVFESLEFTKNLKKKSRARTRARGKPAETTRHVTPRELCAGARDLALRHYGLLAMTVLNQWGIRSTSDLGEIVFNLVEAGLMSKTTKDDRLDFKDVYDLDTALSDYRIEVPQQAEEA